VFIENARGIESASKSLVQLSLKYMKISELVGRIALQKPQSILDKRGGGSVTGKEHAPCYLVDIKQ
jgi:hypothetical protein